MGLLAKRSHALHHGFATAEVQDAHEICIFLGAISVGDFSHDLCIGGWILMEAEMGKVGCITYNVREAQQWHLEKERAEAKHG